MVDFDLEGWEGETVFDDMKMLVRWVLIWRYLIRWLSCEVEVLKKS